MNINDLSNSFVGFTLHLRSETQGIKDNIAQNTADIAQLRIDVDNLPTDGGGAVDSVNGMTGVVVLDATSVGALPDTYIPPAQSWNDLTDKPATFAPSLHTHDGADLSGVVKTVNGLSPDVLGDISVSVDSPVDSVNGQVGVVVLTATDVGALPDTYTPPAQSWTQITDKPTVFTPDVHTHSVNDLTDYTEPDLSGYVTTIDPRLSDARTPTAHTHAVVDIDAAGVAGVTTYLRGDGTWATLPADAVTSVNGQTGSVTLDAASVGALADSYTPPDQTWAQITEKPATFTPTAHTHSVNDLTDYTEPDLTDYVVTTDPRLSDARVPTAHTHSITEITDYVEPDLSSYVVNTDPRLSDARDPLAHSHAIVDVTGLQSALDGKAASSHTHGIIDITGLQTALDGKADDGHTHTEYATTAQGALADTAVQPADLEGTYATETMLADGLALKAATGIPGLPAGSVVRVYWSGSAWPARPTARTDISVEWIGGTDAAPPTAGVVGVDTWMRETV